MATSIRLYMNPEHHARLMEPQESHDISPWWSGVPHPSHTCVEQVWEHELSWVIIAAGWQLPKAPWPALMRQGEPPLAPGSHLNITMIRGGPLCVGSMLVPLWISIILCSLSLVFPSFSILISRFLSFLSLSYASMPAYLLSFPLLFFPVSLCPACLCLQPCPRFNLSVTLNRKLYSGLVPRDDTAPRHLSGMDWSFGS